MSSYIFNATSGLIRYRRRNVGSVRPDTLPGYYVGRIGTHTFTATSRDVAFREVAARAAGYPNLAAMRQHNREVRANNRRNRYRRPFDNMLYRTLEAINRPAAPVTPALQSSSPYAATPAAPATPLDEKTAAFIRSISGE